MTRRRAAKRSLWQQQYGPRSDRGTSSAGQLDGVLADLGEMPEAKFASKRALWVCGLINPLPALGVALEVRPGCLGADSALERLQVAHRGIEDSIFRLERDIEGNGPPFAD